jgi:signal transduction histidine kinase
MIPVYWNADTFFYIEYRFMRQVIFLQRIKSKKQTALRMVIIFLILACSLIQRTVAETKDYDIETLKSVMVFNLLKYIQWPDEHHLDALNVGYLGQNAAYFNALNGMQGQKIRGKKIQIQRLSDLSEASHLQVLVLSEDQNPQLSDIATNTHGAGVLLISENASNKQAIMLNINSSGRDRVRFEVNRYNIVYAKLAMSSDILLLGGTELDIALLLREMEGSLQDSRRQLELQSVKLEGMHREVINREQKLEAQQTKLEQQAIKLKVLQEEAAQSQKRLHLQNDKIDQQNLTLAAQSQQLEDNQRSFDALKREFELLNQSLETSRAQLDSSNQVLSVRQNEITAKETSIKALSRLIDENRQLLTGQAERIKLQNEDIARKEASINQKTEQLASQESTIEVQYRALIIAVVVVVLVLVMSFLIYRANRAKQKANKQLGIINQQLADINNELHETRGQLVESEKMASLGGLVAGVAHEINTPLGISVTAASHLSDRLGIFKQRYQDGKLTRSEFDSFIAEADASSDLVGRNLQRASELVRSFKRVAADQSHEELRQFKLIHYLEEICHSLSPQLNVKGHQVSIEGDADITVNTYPGILAQVITNLVINSDIHGFEGRQNGQIRMTIELDEARVILVYTDDGIGITEAQRPKVFEPFYTTKRNAGGIGLGLNICYSLVNQKLQGIISCEASDSGARFVLQFPALLEL